MYSSVAWLPVLLLRCTPLRLLPQHGYHTLLARARQSLSATCTPSTATPAPSVPSRHVTLGYVCTATTLLDAHVCSSHAAESWCSVLLPYPKLSGLVLYALAVASPSESERLCLMLRSLSDFVDFTMTLSTPSSSPSEAATAAAAATSAFLSTAAHVLTERCCTNQLSTLASLSIAACVYNGKAISFCLKHATLDDIRRILAGCSGCASLLLSSDVMVRHAVLKHCFDATAPPLQRKCLKRLAEVMRVVSSGRFLQQQQQQQQPDDGGTSARWYRRRLKMLPLYRLFRLTALR
jgi:hypothetical protein